MAPAVVCSLIALFGPSAPAAAEYPFGPGHCIQAQGTGAADGQIVIQAGTGVTSETASQLSLEMTTHNVQGTIAAGLGSTWRGYPKQLPILLTAKEFDTDGNNGITGESCLDPATDAIVIRANRASNEITRTAAHEVFHAFSRGITYAEPPWFEEAAATWAESKVGLGEDARYDDPSLQRPTTPLDTSPYGPHARFPYAMSRFLQFLQDRGFIAAGTDWPLVRQVIAGYNPTATGALQNALKAQGVSVGEMAAAFWGDRLKKKPAHGPQLVPKGRENANKETIKPGSETLAMRVGPLSTDLVDFVIDPRVKRVEFEFHPPSESYFWGLVEPDLSREFKAEESVAFCVGGSDVDDLEWPGHFPVTFTNGNLIGDDVNGEVKVFAQTHASEQCTHPSLNRMCRVMREGAEGILGPVSWLGYMPFGSAVGHDGCSRFGKTGDGGDWGGLGIERRRSANGVRKQIRELIRTSPEPCVRVTVGDLACMFSIVIHTEEADDTLWAVAIAHGRDLVSATHTLVPDASSERDTILRLARSYMSVLNRGA